MPYQNLEDLKKDRHDWVESSRKNNFDFDKILSENYSDPSHFIYELLQNADDKKAENVSFNLKVDCLEFHHDGIKFILEHVEGITRIGNPSQNNVLNAIGKFGVGFKSVFAITQNPIIHSGAYHFKITYYVDPEIIPNSPDTNGTSIILPFNHPKHNAQEIFDLIKKRLEDLKIGSILFLNHIKRIEWKTPEKYGNISKTERKLNHQKHIKKIEITTENDKYTYLVFDKSIDIDGESRKIEVAYKQDKGTVIIPEKSAKLFAYFPVEKENTQLSFLIQGPYKTTPNRETVPFVDPQNQHIIQETAHLVAESLHILRDMKLINVNFLCNLPLVCNLPLDGTKPKELYSSIYLGILKEFQSDQELLPTHDGKYISASKAVLARGKGPINLLIEDDLKALFQRDKWLDANITYDNTRDLYVYLTQKEKLGISVIDFEFFTKKLTSEFMEKKPDEWLIRYYKALNEFPKLYTTETIGSTNGIKRDKQPVISAIPIIRLENDKHVLSKDAYLPSGVGSRYQTVKKLFVEDKDILTLFKKLGMKEPDLCSEIKEFTENINAKSSVEYQQLLQKIIDTYESMDQETRTSLSKMKFIKSVNYGTPKVIYNSPTEVYFPTDDLKSYFSGTTKDIYFVSNELEGINFYEKIKIILENLGTLNYPRLIKLENKGLSDDEQRTIRNRQGDTRDNCYGRIKGISYVNYVLEDLDHCLENINKDKSHILWSYLKKFLVNKSSDKAKMFFKLTYKWTYNTNRQEYYENGISKSLKSYAWLYDKCGEKYRPADILVSDLDDKYEVDFENFNILKEALGFRPEIDPSLPEEHRVRLEKTQNRSLADIDEAFSLLDEKRNKAKEPWKPEVKPEEFKPFSQDITEKLESRSAIDQADVRVSRHSQGGGFKKEKIDPEAQKAVGKWAEEHVYQYLKEEEPSGGDIEIVWLNKDGDTGKGCDFILKTGENDTKYIEVKGKQSEAEEWIRITGREWEFANGLFNKDEGDKYWIYVVENAGSSNAVIKKLRNPAKLWKEGKLNAHPINLKL